MRYQRVADEAELIVSCDMHKRYDPMNVKLFRDLVPRMGDITIDMVRTSAQAFVKQDLDLVRRVVARDDEVDHIWYHLLDELVEYMQRDPDLILQATHLLLVARYLERIADHVVNVAERVSYMETGQFQDLAMSHKPEYERPEVESGFGEPGEE